MSASHTRGPVSEACEERRGPGVHEARRREAAAVSPSNPGRPLSKAGAERRRGPGVRCAWRRVSLHLRGLRYAGVASPCEVSRPRSPASVLGLLHRPVPRPREAESPQGASHAGRPVPGGCTLKRPDMLYRFEDRFVQVEVDEDGHGCADEDTRLELIAADVGLPGLVLRLNPDAERILKRKRLRNGESCFYVGDAAAFNALFDAAEAAVEGFVDEQAPEGVRVVGLPATWWGQ